MHGRITTLVFFRVVLRHGLISPTLWIGDDGLQACIVWGDAPTDISLVISRSHFKRSMAIAVFKACYGEGVCKCHFSLLLVQCNFQSPTDGVQLREEEV